MRIAELVNHQIFERKWRSRVTLRACLFECPYKLDFGILHYVCSDDALVFWKINKDMVFELFCNKSAADGCVLTTCNENYKMWGHLKNTWVCTALPWNKLKKLVFFCFFLKVMCTRNKTVFSFSSSKTWVVSFFFFPSGKDKKELMLGESSQF